MQAGVTLGGVTSEIYACGLTLLFAFIVAQLSNRTLAKINMIEALKSIE